MNVVCLVGRLTADPELRSTPNGTAVASFTVAVDRYSKGKEKKADFINCIAWRGTAEFVSKYFSKGKQISIEGSLQVRTYNDKDGKRRYVTEVLAGNVKFVGAKEKANIDVAPDPACAEDFTPIDDNEDLPF